MINMNKRYRTRDGREVRLESITKNRYVIYPIKGTIEKLNGFFYWTRTGTYFSTINVISNYDLVEIKEEEDTSMCRSGTNRYIVVRQEPNGVINKTNCPGKTHNSIESAFTEADRLAKEYPGCTFTVFNAIRETVGEVKVESKYFCNLNDA